MEPVASPPPWSFVPPPVVSPSGSCSSASIRPPRHWIHVRADGSASSRLACRRSSPTKPTFISHSSGCLEACPASGCLSVHGSSPAKPCSSPTHQAAGSSLTRLVRTHRTRTGAGTGAAQTQASDRDGTGRLQQLVQRGVEADGDDLVALGDA